MADLASIQALLARLGPGGADRNPLPFTEFAHLPPESCAEALRLERVLTTLPRPFRPGRLLQLDCGTGYACFAFAARGYRCTGLESDPAMLAVAQAANDWRASGIDFRTAKPTPELLAGLEPYDVALWLDGAEAALQEPDAGNLLAAILAKATTLFIAARQPVAPPSEAIQMDCLGPLPGAANQLLFRLQPRRRADLQALMPAALAEMQSHMQATQPIYAKENAHFISRVFPATLGSERAALKLVQAKSEMARLLLYREHEFLHALPGPSFPKPLGFGFDGSRYLLILPWLDGPNLAQLLTAQQASQVGTLKKPEALRAAISAAAAQLRDAGIRHRDLRPHNVMLTPNGPMILDFGWACWADEIDCPAPPQLAVPDDDAAIAALLAAIR